MPLLPFALRWAIDPHALRGAPWDAKSAYVAISRARKGAALYTDSREGLANAIETRTGERETALAAERAAPAIARQAEKATPAKGGQGMGLG